MIKVALGTDAQPGETVLAAYTIPFGGGVAYLDLLQFIEGILLSCLDPNSGHVIRTNQIPAEGPDAFDLTLIAASLLEPFDLEVGGRIDFRVFVTP